MIAKIILYAVKTLNDQDIDIGKTYIQKLLYLLYDNEQRNLLYVPYFYGPYSEMTQLLLNSMINTKYLNYDKKFTVSNDLKINNTLFHNKDEKKLKERTDKIISFLDKNKLNNTKEISNFSKTFMILSNNDNYEGDKSELVKKRSLLLGWSELSKLSSIRIKSYIEKCEEFSKTIPS